MFFESEAMFFESEKSSSLERAMLFDSGWMLFDILPVLIGCARSALTRCRGVKFSASSTY